MPTGTLIAIMVSHRHRRIVKGYSGIFVVVILLALSFLVLFAMHLVKGRDDGLEGGE